jgi:hypothetical protein
LNKSLINALPIALLLVSSCTTQKTDTGGSVTSSSPTPSATSTPKQPLGTSGNTAKAKIRVAAVPFKAYVCGDPGAITHAHCYAVAGWDSPRQRVGFFAADVSVVDLEAQANQFLDDELWLIDKACRPVCWIEAGFMSDRTSNFSGPVYFWAVGRPHNKVDVSYFGPVDKTQLGRFARIELGGSGNSWLARITPPGSRAAFNSGTVSLTMNPSLINLGQELSGTHGSRAPKARFQRIYAGRSAPGSPIRSNADLDISNPPYGGWQTKPGVGRDSIFYTQCC